MKGNRMWIVLSAIVAITAITLTVVLVNQDGTIVPAALSLIAGLGGFTAGYALAKNISGQKPPGGS